MKRVALYARASTGGESTEKQLRDLNDAAGRCSWAVVGEFVERCNVGGRSKGERLALERLMAAVARREVDLVAAWSLDRLGHTLPELIGFLCELRANEVDLYLHQPGVDTCTPTGRALYQLLDVFEDCQRTLAVEGTLAGANTTWTVKGVSEETREAVREAAAKQRLSVGAWMDHALWEAAQTVLKPTPPPATPEDVERIVQRLLDQRLEPLVRRGAQLERT